jgi:cobalamin biosynthesis protein CbiD
MFMVHEEMRMRWKRVIVLSAACGAVLSAQLGCAKKTTKKVTVETPNKKYEVEVEKTERK